MQQERTESGKSSWWMRLHGVGPVLGLLLL